MNHRNSQKRHYFDNSIVFITTNTFKSYPFFDEDIFCKVFVEDLGICQSIKKFEIFGFKINPDHVHLLIQPLGKYDYSEIMRSLKTNFSHNMNGIMGFNDLNTFKLPTKARSRDLAFDSILKLHFDKLVSFRKQFIKQYGKHPFPKFKWQSSFYDHIIRNEKDFRQHISYIQQQHLKHQLPSNKFCFINERAINNIL